MCRSATVLALLSAAVVMEASAQPVEGGIMVGYGVEKKYEWGLGGRFGTTLPLRTGILGAPGLHLGGRGVYHWGRDTEMIEVNDIVGQVETRVFYFAAELGLAWFYRGISVRPVGLIGSAGVNVDAEAEPSAFVVSGTGTDYELLLSPALMVTGRAGRVLLAGEVQYLFVDNADSFAFYGTIGISTGP